MFPSPPFPDPKGDVSGSAWEGPDLPRTARGKGVGDDSIFQVFGISGLCLVQPLTARCWAIADVLADPGPRGGRAMWVGSTVVLPFNIRALYTHDHTSPLYSLFPGHAPGWWWWYPRPRKRAMEQFKVAVSSWSFFPVINLEATSQLLFKMFHPRAQAPSLLHGDLGPRSSVTVPWPDAQVGHSGWEDVT